MVKIPAINDPRSLICAYDNNSENLQLRFGQYKILLNDIYQSFEHLYHKGIVVYNLALSFGTDFC